MLLSFIRLGSPCTAACVVALQCPAEDQGCGAEVGSEGINAKADLSGEVSLLGCDGWMPPRFLSSGTLDGSCQTDLGGQ